MALSEAQIGEKEKLPLEERLTTPEIPPEIEHVEAIAGAEITLPKPITDSSGQPILDNAAPQQVTITLPLTEEEMQQALHLKIIYSLRWLAEWVKRLTKIIRGNFLYRFK
jgi:sugar (pentulose or hexulose) kinase